MTGQVSQDPERSDEPREETGTGEFGNAGVGAASALQHMRSQHERRHKRLHGTVPAWPARASEDAPE